MTQSGRAGRPRAIIVIGVAGAGKTTLARRLAQRLNWTYGEGDDFHSAANIRQMSVGEPLTDGQRRPWLIAIRQWLDTQAAQNVNAVVSCSALKRDHRDLLRHAAANVSFVYLCADEEVLRSRLVARRGHFMSVDLLTSQLEALEPPTGELDSITVDATVDLDETVDTVLKSLDLDGRSNASRLDATARPQEGLELRSCRMPNN